MIDWNPAGLYRDRYPGANASTYLDVAAVGIIASDVRGAVAREAIRHENLGIAAAPERAETLGRARLSLGQLVNGRSDRIAFTQNTSTGLALVANGLDWRSGDNLLVPQEEFPSNFYPWTQLRRRGIEVREIPMPDGYAHLSEIARHIDQRTRILAISAVQYSSGHRYDLTAIGELCERAGVLLVVDGTQAVGALQIDVSRDRIDVLAVSAHKWMLGPLGIGFVHLSDRAMNSLRPSTVGWLSVAEPFRFDHEPDLAPDARRFESGTENMSGIEGLDAAVNLVLSVGTATVEHQVLTTRAQLGDALQAQGWTLLHQHSPGTESGLLFATTGDDDSATFARLQDAGVRCSVRGGGIRFSPHYFTSTDDIEQVVLAGE